MHKVIDLLEAVKEKYGLTNKAQIAALLDVSRSNITNWTSGLSAPNHMQSTRIAELLDLCPTYVIAVTSLHNANDPKAKAYWLDVAERYESQNAKPKTPRRPAKTQKIARFRRASDKV